MTDQMPFDPAFITIAIRAGLIDHMFDDITSAIQRRKALLAAEKLSELSIGDRIDISASVRPQLLAGCPCEVTSFEGGDKVKVRLLATRSSKWRSGMIVTLDKGLIGNKMEMI